MKDFPLVEYAKKIGKNTAEFTIKDLAGFMKWWLPQKQREDLIKMGANYKQDLAAMKKFREEGARVNQTEVSASEELAEALENGIMKKVSGESEIVCSMELTKIDVEALLWAINEIFENYDLTGSIHDLSLQSLKEGLEGV